MFLSRVRIFFSFLLILLFINFFLYFNYCVFWVYCPFSLIYIYRMSPHQNETHCKISWDQCLVLVNCPAACVPSSIKLKSSSSPHLTMAFFQGFFVAHTGKEKKKNHSSRLVVGLWTKTQVIASPVHSSGFSLLLLPWGPWQLKIQS